MTEPADPGPRRDPSYGDGSSPQRPDPQRADPRRFDPPAGQQHPGEPWRGGAWQQGGAEPTTWATGDDRRPDQGAYGVRPPAGGSTPWPAPTGSAQTQTLPYQQSHPQPLGVPGHVPHHEAGPGRQGRTPGAGRRLIELLLVALLAAALAAAGTYAFARPAPTTVDDTARQVQQADPNSPNWTATASVVSPSVVSIRVDSASGEGEGSGVIIDAKGQVATNNHVVAAGGESSQITVTLDDKRAYTAKVLGTDPQTDLAVLQLENAPGDLRAISMGDDTKLKVGDPVMAVGNPLGLSGTVTTGIVSALNRPVRTQGEGGQGGANAAVVTNAIQTSAAINPGNSGGALVNASGQLVGINSSIASLSQSSGNIGIGFAIPVNEVKSVTAQLVESGKAKHALLGVKVRADVVADGSDKRAAAVITEVVDGAAAAKAGLKAKDAVIAVDGETVDSDLALVAQIGERKVGDQVTLTVVRDGKRQEVPVVLDEKP